MRRRRFLAVAGAGVATVMSGCLDGEVVVEMSEVVRIQGGDGWTAELSEPSGSAEVGYTAKSNDDRFEVFYFTNESEFMKYEEFISVEGEKSDEDVRSINNRNAGHEKLSAISRQVASGSTFEAMRPESGRYSIDFDTNHYVALDYSNYGKLPLEDTNQDIQVTLELEVVEDRF